MAVLLLDGNFVGDESLFMISPRAGGILDANAVSVVDLQQISRRVLVMLLGANVVAPVIKLHYRRFHRFQGIVFNDIFLGGGTGGFPLARSRKRRKELAPSTPCPGLQRCLLFVV